MSDEVEYDMWVRAAARAIMARQQALTDRDHAFVQCLSLGRSAPKIAKAVRDDLVKLGVDAATINGLGVTHDTIYRARG